MRVASSARAPARFVVLQAAAVVCLVLMLAGWTLGTLLSFSSGGLKLGGLTLLLLGGGTWATSRVGGSGIAAAVIGCLAFVGAANEFRHWRLAHTDAQELATWASWDPTIDVSILHGPRLLHERSLSVRQTRRVRSGRSSSTLLQREAIPLVEVAGGPVVGFACRDASFGSPHDLVDGAWAAALVPWTGEFPEPCAEAIAASAARVREASRSLAPAAEERVLLVFGSEAALRDAAQLGWALGFPMALSAVLLLVLFFRGKSPNASPSRC